MLAGNEKHRNRYCIDVSTIPDESSRPAAEDYELNGLRNTTRTQIANQNPVFAGTRRSPEGVGEKSSLLHAVALRSIIACCR